MIPTIDYNALLSGMFETNKALGQLNYPEQWARLREAEAQRDEAARNRQIQQDYRNALLQQMQGPQYRDVPISQAKYLQQQNALAPQMRLQPAPEGMKPDAAQAFQAEQQAMIQKQREQEAAARYQQLQAAGQLPTQRETVSITAPSSYGEALALREQANEQITSYYAPAMKAAYESGDDAERARLVDEARSTGLPGLVRMAGVYDKMKFTGKDEIALTGDMLKSMSDAELGQRGLSRAQVDTLNSDDVLKFKNGKLSDIKIEKKTRPIADKPTAYRNTVEDIRDAAAALKLPPAVVRQALGFTKDKSIGALEFVQNPDATWAVKPTWKEPKYTQGTGVDGDAGESPISTSAQKMLEETYTNATEVGKLKEQFVPRYLAVSGRFGAIPKTVADAVQYAKRQYGDDSEVANWWMGYQEFINKYRKGLFGTALSKNEKAEFEKAIINPGMPARTVAAYLNRQEDILSRAYERVRSGQARGKQRRAVEESYPGLEKPKRGSKDPLGIL